MSELMKPETTTSLSTQEVGPVAHQLADAYWRALKAEAEGRYSSIRHPIREKEQLLNASPDSLEWHHLSYVEQVEPGAGFEVYDKMKQDARDELESGTRSANLVGGGVMRPWVKARYLALRDSFIADWQPTGSIEVRLIEMLAQLYRCYEYWMEISAQRIAFECQQERFQVQERGTWRAVSVNGDAEMQQAAEMGDRFNRQFLRTLRQLRDLRRYNVPVTINNPKQVNIAADGGQQVNVAQKEKKGRKKLP